MHREQCLLYESGEFSLGEASKFEKHLGGCLECRERLETARAAHRWADTAAPEPPERLTAAVLFSNGRVSAGSRVWDAAFACACLVLALSLARTLGPLLPGAVAADEDLERLRGDARRLEMGAYE